MALGLVCAVSVPAFPQWWWWQQEPQPRRQRPQQEQQAEPTPAPRRTPAPPRLTPNPDAPPPLKTTPRSRVTKGREARSAQPTPVAVVLERPRVDIIGEPEAVSTTQPITAAPTPLAELLQHQHVGSDFHYAVFGLPTNTPAVIELGFAEFEYREPGHRVFDVVINGKHAIDDFDPIAAAGGPHRAVFKKFSITPAHGVLDIHFLGVRGSAVAGYARIQVGNIDEVISPRTAGKLASTPRADWNPETGEIYHDGMTHTWPSGVPFGGIGTGKFEILPNGRFANFTTNNSWDSPVRSARGTFLAVFAKARSGGGNAHVLRVPEPFTLETEYVNAEPLGACTYKGLYPFAEWTFHDSKVPLRVSMDCFSPMIPQNRAESRIPGAILTVNVENPNRYPVSAAVAFSWEDINGRGGSVRGLDAFHASPRLTHSDAETSEVAGIRLAADAVSPHTGEYFIGAETSGVVITRLLNWNPGLPEIPWIGQFAETGRLPKRDKKHLGMWNSTDNAPSAAVISASFNLAPRERRSIPFVIAWYVPDLGVRNSGELRTAIQDYTTSFASAVGVASYLGAHHRQLRAGTAEWHQLVLQSNLPGWLKVKMLNSAFPLAANTVVRGVGEFSMLESPQDLPGVLGGMGRRIAGSPLLASLFPRLNVSELEWFGSCQQPDGSIPHHLGNLAGGDSGVIGADCPDVTCAWVTQMVAACRATGDHGLLERSFPRLSNAMTFLKSADRDGDSIPDGGNAFAGGDVVAGASTYNAIWYLGALRAAHAAAESLGDSVASSRFAGEFAAAQASVVQHLWSGSWLIKQKFISHDAANPNSFIGVLAGDWGARSIGLAPVLPEEMVTTATASIADRHLARYSPVPPTDVTPEGAGAGTETPLSLCEPYFGFEAFYNGGADDGLEMLHRTYQAAWQINSNPWEQAFTYTSPEGQKGRLKSHPSASATWGVIPAMTGFAVDLPGKTIYFDPHIPKVMGDELHVPVFTPSFWGWIDRGNGTTSTLRVIKVFPEWGAHEIAKVARRVNSRGVRVDERLLRPPVAIREGAEIPLE